MCPAPCKPPAEQPGCELPRGIFLPPALCLPPSSAKGPGINLGPLLTAFTLGAAQINQIRAGAGRGRKGRAPALCQPHQGGCAPAPRRRSGTQRPQPGGSEPPPGAEGGRGEVWRRGCSWALILRRHWRIRRGIWSTWGWSLQTPRPAGTGWEHTPCHGSATQFPSPSVPQPIKPHQGQWGGSQNPCSLG